MDSLEIERLRDDYQEYATEFENLIQRIKFLDIDEWELIEELGSDLLNTAEEAHKIALLLEGDIW